MGEADNGEGTKPDRNLGSQCHNLQNDPHPHSPAEEEKGYSAAVASLMLSSSEALSKVK